VRRRLCEVAEHGDRPGRRAPADGPQCHGREVLRFVDDHVADRRGSVEQVRQLVEQGQVGG